MMLEFLKRFFCRILRTNLRYPLSLYPEEVIILFSLPPLSWREPGGRF
jgi:hypothetical protein